MILKVCVADFFTSKSIDMNRHKTFKPIAFAVVHNRQHKLNDRGEALIQIRAYRLGKSRYFSTGIHVEPKDWDPRNKRVKASHPAAFHLNGAIQEKIRELETQERDMVFKYGTCPLELLDREQEEELTPEAGLTFTRFFLQHIDRYEEPATKKGYRTTLKHLRQYRKEVLFSDLTYRFIDGFDRHLKKKGLSLVTIGKYHKNVKAVINKAIQFDYMFPQDNPYIKFKPRPGNPNRVFLTTQELRNIEGLSLKDRPHLENIRKVFLLSCYTGFRFGDVMKLAPIHLEESERGVSIRKPNQKTKKDHHLPVYTMFKQPGTYSKPEEILREELDRHQAAGRQPDRPFFRMTNQHLNREIKVIARLAGIHKTLSHRIARRTFATELAPRVEMPTLQKLLNHSTLDMTKIYIQLSNHVVTRQLEQIENWD
jgi:integrase